MKKILLAILASCLFALTAVAVIGLPGTVDSTVKGVSVDNALACLATDLDSESKELYTLWADLNEKFVADTLTEEELLAGNAIAQSGQCFNIIGGLEGTVVLLDGHDYLVDYCAPEWGCVRVIQKSDGFERQ